MWTICASSVSRADPLGAHHQRCRSALIVPPITCSPELLRHRHRLAGDHRLVHRARALEDHAVHRHLLARPHAETIADARSRPARPSSSPPSARRARAVFGARSSSARMAPLVALARAQFQHLAEQDQHGDHRRRLEIDRHRAARAAKRRREEAGRERRDDAVDSRRRRCPCAISVNMFEAARDERTPSRARRTASPPRAPPAWRARAAASSTMAADDLA